jgi:hypothetical protein
MNRAALFANKTVEEMTNPTIPYQFIPGDSYNMLLAAMNGKDDDHFYLHKPKWLLKDKWEDKQLKEEWDKQIEKVKKQKEEQDKQTKKNDLLKQQDSWTDENAPMLNLKDENSQQDDDGLGGEEESEEGTTKSGKKKRGRKGKKSAKAKAKKEKSKELTQEQKLERAKEFFGDVVDLCGSSMDEFLNNIAEAVIYAFKSGISEYDMDLSMIMAYRQTFCPPILKLDENNQIPHAQIEQMIDRLKESEGALKEKEKKERDEEIEDVKAHEKLKEAWKKLKGREITEEDEDLFDEMEILDEKDMEGTYHHVRHN